MATLTSDGDDITVRLTTFEKAISWRGDVHVAASTVRTVELIDDPIRAIRGLKPTNFKILGSFIPGRLAVGSFFDGSVHRKLFAAVHANQSRGLRIDLAEGGPYSQLIVSLEDPEAAKQLFHSQ